MSPPGRPKGEFLTAEPEGPVTPPGRPKGEFLTAEPEGIPMSAGFAPGCGTPPAGGWPQPACGWPLA
jgi:hypothetical protein